MKYIVIASIGALASILSNQLIAVFHNGLRPLMPDYFDGRISRKQLATISFAMSIGIIVGLGIPTTVATSIILIHTILLTTDTIGLFFSSSKRGMLLSALIGAIYALFVLIGLDFIVEVFAWLPYNFLDALSDLSKYILVSYTIFPALVVAYQKGFIKGMITAGVSVGVYLFISKYNVLTVKEVKIELSAEGIAMLVGAIMMVLFALKLKENEKESSIHYFLDNIEKIKKNYLPISLMGGLIACATSMNLVGNDPVSQMLMVKGLYNEALLVVIVRLIGFIPQLLVTTFITGVYAPAGIVAFPIGLLLHEKPFLAFLLGGLGVFFEVYFISSIARWFDRFSGIEELGEYIPKVTTKILEFSLFVGSITSAEIMASDFNLTGFGAMFIIGVVLFNRTLKKPMVELMIGPVACILFGILMNLFIIA